MASAFLCSVISMPVDEWSVICSVIYIYMKPFKFILFHHRELVVGSNVTVSVCLFPFLMCPYFNVSTDTGAQ